MTLMNVCNVPAAPHETTIGQRPASVLLPTFQLQLTRPATDGRSGDRPAALDGPLLYETVIRHVTARGITAAVKVAVVPAATGDVMLTSRTDAPADPASTSAIKAAAASANSFLTPTGV